MPITRAGLSADQFQDVGVLLLRHDAATRADRVGQGQEAEFLGAPEDPLLGPAGEVLGDHRQHEDRLDDEVAVARDIQAVGRDPFEAQFPGHEIAIDRQAGAGQSRGTEREDVQPPATIGQPRSIPFQFLDIGQEIVGSQHRLSPLHVRIAGQDHRTVPQRRRDQRPLKADQARVDPVERLACPELDTRGDLIVATPRRVQLPTDIAQLLN